MEMRERIRAIRTSEKVHMTQAEFSTALGLAPTSAASWEKKSNPQVPTETMRMLICEKFGVNREWLETGRGDMFTQQSHDDALKQAIDSPIVRRALESFLKLDEPWQENVIELLEAMVSKHTDSNS